jgi:ComEC/Rec2-related protein
VRIGDIIRMTGASSPARDDASRERAYLERRGCANSLFASAMVIESPARLTAHPLAAARERLGDALQAIAPGDEGVLLVGLVTGDDAALSDARKAAFRATGTTHLTAVSGSNLALIAGMLSTLGVAAFGRHRVIWQVATIAGVWAYALVSGAHSPAVRAAIVATAAICAFRFGRKPDYPTLILLAAGIMVLADPGQIASVGFQLSVVSSLALAIALPGMVDAGWRRAIAGALAASSAAQVATLPILLATFGTISLVSLPANLLVAPMAAIAMPLAGAAALTGALWLPAGEAIGVAAVLGARSMLVVVDVLGSDRASVAVGRPPLAAVVAIGVACAALLFVLGEDGQRAIRRARKTRQSRPANTLAAAGIDGGSMELSAAPESVDALLAAPAALVLGREDPANALAADANDAIEDPARQEDGHEIAEIRQCGETVPGDV